MRASRGMGAINPSKMPRGKTITRKDKPQFVKEYKKGGQIKMLAEGGESDKIKSKVKPYRKIK